MTKVTELPEKDSLPTMKSKTRIALPALILATALGALVFLPFLIVEILEAPLPEIALGILYGLSVGVIAWAFFFVALKRLPVFQYGALSYMEVFFAVLFGTLILGEEITVFTIGGIILVLSASVLSRFIAKKI